MKRKFQLTGAILSIILGSIEVLGGLIILAGSTVAESIGLDSVLGMLLLATVASLAFGLSVIILGAKFCREQKSKGVAIALIVLISVLILLSFANLNAISILWLLVRLVTLGMLIAYLVLKDDTASQETVESVATVETVQPAKPLNKIELLTSLRNNGTITEEEFKDLLKKELEK